MRGPWLGVQCQAISMGDKLFLLRWPLVLTLVGAMFSSSHAQSSGESSSKLVGTWVQLPEPQGAQRCQFCHSSEVEGYARSAMAHSLRRAGSEPNGSVTTGDSRITIHSSNDGYWQQLENNGGISKYRIDYVIGSGKHASGYLLDLSGHLFQSPVAYYKSRQAYDLAPGYQKVTSPDFTRPISEACLFCHSGSALKIPGTANAYRSPPFLAESITCERCHGSAERHLADPRAGTIINPAKLGTAARDSICEQCHLLGAGRVLNPGKKFSDFQPGEPLEDVFTTYHDVLPQGEQGQKFKVISHVEQLARSTCVQKSDGRMWCGTCHDPHNQPADPIGYFRSKCLTCHSGKLSDGHPDRESNCIGCHMPRRDAKDGGHTAFTDHRIQRRPESEGTLPVETDIAAWRQPGSNLQKRNLGIAYINVGMDRHSREFIGRGYRMLTEVQSEFANDSEVFSAMGTALLLAGEASEAQLAFERVLQLQPNSVSAETNLASAFLKNGKPEQAVAHLERAVAMDPLHLPAVEPLIDLYKQEGNTAKAVDLSARMNSIIEKDSSRKQESEKPSTVDQSKTAEAVYKNIQVLKGIPADQLIPAMRFITASLGVSCSYCHVSEHFDRDDKKPKVIARNMMKIMAAINEHNFDGMREITCYSCHRGSSKPESTPIVAEEVGEKHKPESEGSSGSMPTADQIIDDYIQAIGGAAAIEQVANRKERGTITMDGTSATVEIVSRDPDQRLVRQHSPHGDTTWVFDGRQGWFSSPGHPVRELSGDELDAARIDADLHFPLHLRKICADVRVENQTAIGSHDAYVLSCANERKPPVHLYFDRESKLLVRMTRYMDTPLGRIPSEIDLSDYRDAGALKIPFRRAVMKPDGIALTQIERIESNVPIDAAEFAKPVLDGPKTSGQ